MLEPAEALLYIHHKPIIYCYTCFTSVTRLTTGNSVNSSFLFSWVISDISDTTTHPINISVSEFFHNSFFDRCIWLLTNSFKSSFIKTLCVTKEKRFSPGSKSGIFKDKSRCLSNIQVHFQTLLLGLKPATEQTDVSTRWEDSGQKRTLLCRPTPLVLWEPYIRGTSLSYWLKVNNGSHFNTVGLIHSFSSS